MALSPKYFTQKVENSVKIDVIEEDYFLVKLHFFGTYNVHPRN